LKEQSIEPQANEIGKLFFRGRAHRAHGRLNPSTLRGDLLIRFAAQPPLEFIVSPAGKRQVCVRIDESWTHDAPARIDADCAGRQLDRFMRFGRGPNPRNRPFGNCDSRVRNAPDFGEIFAAPRSGKARPFHGESFGRIFEEKIADGTNHRSVIPGRSSPFSFAHSIARS
jgi:hypothetical protein